MGKYQKLEREKVVKYKSFINKRTIWDHLGVLRGVLGGSQTKNTRNMGKYQKLETERTIRSKSCINKSFRICLNICLKTIWDHLEGVLRGSQTENTRNMGKYQKLETEKWSNQLFSLTNVSG